MKAAGPLVVAAILATAGCGSSTLATTPSSNAQPITETFSGTVPVGGSDFHNFTAAQQGEIDLALTAAGPPPTITMGVAIGTPSAGVCTPISSGNVAASSSVYNTGTFPAGTYCVAVVDIGNAAGPITYTVTVTHY